MRSNQMKYLRWMVVMVLVLLGFQYLMGMAVNLSPSLPDLAAFGFSLARIADALHQAGTVALAHAILGSTLAILSIVTLVLSLVSGIRKIQVFAVLGALSIFLAASGGVLFVLSGFQDDNFSLMMASNFLLAFTFYFLELYFLRPEPKIQVH